jgi:hypothetical protein
MIFMLVQFPDKEILKRFIVPEVDSEFGAG